MPRTIYKPPTSARKSGARIHHLSSARDEPIRVRLWSRHTTVISLQWLYWATLRRNINRWRIKVTFGKWMTWIDKRRSPFRLLRRDLIPTSALPRVLFIVPHGMWVCCSSAALCVSIASMSIARDVIPQQILGSCADCQSASLSFAPASDAGLPSPSSTLLSGWV